MKRVWFDVNNSNKVVDYELANDIAFIYLNRPHRLNAVIPQLVEELLNALEKASNNEVKAVILSGRGKSFCSGHDLKESESKNNSEPKSRLRLQKIQDVTRRIRQAPFPVIAAVHGYALGAGCEFALCCDLIIAEKDAEFGFPEVSVGLSVTGGISHIMPNAIGLVKSKELLFLGERFSAVKAKELGLINFVVNNQEELKNASIELAIRLSKLPQSSLAKAKFVLNNGAQVNFESTLEMEIEHALSSTGSRDAEQAAEKFRGKKKTR